MDPLRWERIEEILQAALRRPAHRRMDFVARATEGDELLHGEVQSLIREHESDPDFLETPFARVAALDAMDAADRDVEPDTIGPYRLIRRLGRGGMGEVHLAVREAEDFKHYVALKVIRPGMDTDEVLRRFRLERQIVASLHHPNVAHLLDAGATADGRPYFVMEYVEGEPIDAFCDRNLMTVPDRLRLFRTVCDAVQHAHRSLIVHRDLKPGNILVTLDGVPKLLDFGIGKILDPETVPGEAPGETRADVRIFTPEYASPEQIGGRPVTTLSDVYGLGVLLYELLSGHHPWSDGNRSVAEIEGEMKRGEPRAPSVVVGQVRTRRRGTSTETLTPEEVSMRRRLEPHRLSRRLSGDLDNIVLRALRPEPDRRYPSAEALSDDIQRHLDGLPVRARPDTLSYRALKFCRRNALPLAAATIVAVTLGASSAVTYVQSQRVARERDEALEIRNFLLESFGATGADQATGEVVTARQLLDRQAVTLERSYGDRPGLRAEMLMVLAEAYERLGLYEDAEGVARRALDIREEIHGPGHSEVAASLVTLGWILHQLDRSGEAEPMLRRAVGIRSSRGGGTPQDLARALNDLGVVRDELGDHEESEVLFRRSLELRRVAVGEDHRAYGVTANNLAALLYRKGDYAGAVEVGEEAVRSLRTGLGFDHQRTIIAGSNLAAYRAALGDLAGSEEEYRGLLDRQTMLQGRDHPVTANLIVSVAALAGLQGRYAEAEPLFREALEIRERVLGSDHREVADVRVRLGNTLTALGRWSEAREHLEAGLAIQRAVFGDRHTAVATTLAGLSSLQWRRGDRTEAESLLRAALEVYDGTVGPDHPATARQRARLGDLLLEMERPGEALEAYRASQRVLEAAPSSSGERVHRTSLGMAEAALHMGQSELADSLLRTVRVAMESGSGPESLVARLESLEAGIAARPPAGPR